MYKIIFVIFIIITIPCCNENNSTEPDKNYSGITHTGENDPTPIGEIDSDDWYYTTNQSSGGEPVSIPLGFTVWPAYPNPTQRNSILQIATPMKMPVKIWIDDPMSNKETTVLNDTLNAGVYQINIDLFYGNENYERKEGIVRVFINFLGAKDIPLIHGDIQIIR